MVVRKQVITLCDVCEKDRPTRRVRIGWIGGRLRGIDLCDEHAATVDKLLAAVERHRPAARGIAAIPVAATPEDVLVGPPDRSRRRNTPLRAPETGPGREKLPPG